MVLVLSSAQLGRTDSLSLLYTGLLNTGMASLTLYRSLRGNSFCNIGGASKAGNGSNTKGLPKLLFHPHFPNIIPIFHLHFAYISYKYQLSFTYISPMFDLYFTYISPTFHQYFSYFSPTF